MFNIKKFDLLVSIYIFCIIASELMGGKTFYLLNIGGYAINASVAILLLPIIFTINDVIVEVFGKDRARSVVKSGLAVIILLILFSLAATALPPSNRFNPTESAYDSIFMISIRFSMASLAAFIIAEFMDIRIFSSIRGRFGRKNLWLRNNVSNFLAQFFDTSIFLILAFYAINRPFGDNFAFIFSLFLPYWLLKCTMSIIETPFVYLGTAWLRKDKAANAN